ncbi:MAG: hypothetical protein WC861_05110 [Candidatus Micrarchaeia archaeon]|jgi:hypothetical protein
MMVIDKAAPKGSVCFRDALLFAKYSHDTVARGKGMERLDALCDRIVGRAVASLGMEGMTPCQMERIRKALAATAAIDGFDTYRELSRAKGELEVFAGIVALASTVAGVASGSVGTALGILLFGVPYSLLKSLSPRCNALCAYMHVAGLQDKIWSAINSGAKAGKEDG